MSGCWSNVLAHAWRYLSTVCARGWRSRCKKSNSDPLESKRLQKMPWNEWISSIIFEIVCCPFPATKNLSISGTWYCKLLQFQSDSQHEYKNEHKWESLLTALQNDFENCVEPKALSLERTLNKVRTHMFIPRIEQHRYCCARVHPIHGSSAMLDSTRTKFSCISREHHFPHVFSRESRRANRIVLQTIEYWITIVLYSTGVHHSILRYVSYLL